MIYTYISTENAHDAIKAEIDAFLKQQNMNNPKYIEDTDSNKTPWTDRKLFNLVHNETKAGDEIVVYEASDLARSTLQILDILMQATERGIKIHFIKYHEQFEAKEVMDTKAILHLMQIIESDFISKRTTEALQRRRDAGLPLGRPKGRKNKSLKLDKHKEDIVKYLKLKVSKASIAKLVGCHPQTLYDYIDTRDLYNEEESESAATA